MKVRIKSLGLPKAAYGQQANYGLSLNGSGNAGSMQSNEFAMKSGLKPKRTISGVPREEANLEAEGGETVVGQISGDGIVDHMTIKGPRHSNGGVPMNLPDDSFIFSDTASMKIKDPKILQMFGKGKGSYTPAELAKPYDISKYKAILMDSDTDKLSRNTAEIMIKNIVMKLGALALAQEAKKGFPQGIPEIAKPYMEANGIAEEDLMPELRAQAEQMQAMQQQQAMQMQQAQGMQQPQMQQQGPPQGMPQMMPDGQPAAMPSQPMMDPQQMMAMQQEQQMMPPQPQQGMPMAAYGMQLGGYDMPFVMGNGGMMRYHNGGTGSGHPHGDETVDGREATKVDALPEDGVDAKTDQSGFEAKTIEERIAAEKAREAAGEARGAGTTPSSGWEDSICDRIKAGATWEELTDPEVALEKTGSRKTHLSATSASAKAIWERCKGNQNVFEETVKETDVYIVPVENKTEGTCGCPDPEGGTNEDGTPKLINVQTKAALGIPEDKPCDDEYCEEITTTTENTPEVDELTPMPVIPGVSFNTGVADPIKAPLDIVDSSGRNYLDYRTAVQNDQGAIEKQIAAIKTMPGLTVGQRQGMIAQLQSQSKAPSIVTDVYNKNVATANELAKSDTALAANQQQLQAGIDGQYNQALAQSQNQRTQNINAARQYNVENTKDNMRMAMMAQSINNASENFDALGNFIGGTKLSAEMMCYECVKKAGVAACAQYCPGGSGNTQEEKPTEEKAKPNEGTQVARYGGVVNPYIMASSVYPWSK